MAEPEAGYEPSVTDTGFAREDRERVRSALLRYMDENQIGIPTLQKRIASHNGRSEDLIPLKTLQRFVAGTHRTNDAFVALCYKFAQNFALPAASDGLGDALLRFLDLPGPAAGADTRSGAMRLKDMLAHNYRGTAATDNGEVDYSELEIEAVPYKDHFRVRETVRNRLLQPGAAPSNSPAIHRYEGIVVGNESGLFGVLREELTGYIKTYALSVESDDPIFKTKIDLMGQAVEMPFEGSLLSATVPRSFPITLRRES